VGQQTTGLRAILSNPGVYSFFQNLMGTQKLRTDFVRDYIRPDADHRCILDVGCGPADILDCLPPVEYYGFDISEAYIEQAGARFGSRGTFSCGILKLSDLDNLPKFDVVLALGVLHHLDDETAGELCNIAYHALRPGGRFVTFDPCFTDPQNPVARFLVSMDRGQNVRTEEEYRGVASQVFSTHRSLVKHRAWIPYTHCFMECTRT
jgi:SAM-dependent methyltransferase